MARDTGEVKAVVALPDASVVSLIEGCLGKDLSERREALTPLVRCVSEAKHLMI